jgi:hypothetical protein
MNANRFINFKIILGEGSNNFTELLALKCLSKMVVEKGLDTL